MITTKACEGAITEPCRMSGMEHGQKCQHCGTKVRDDMVDHSFFGFAANCSHHKVQADVLEASPTLGATIPSGVMPLTATVIHPDGSTAAISLATDEDARLSQLQELVGGPIEGVPLADGRYMLVNEDGKKGSHLRNQLATDLAHSHESIMASDYIAGEAVILPKEALDR